MEYQKKSESGATLSQNQIFCFSYFEIIAISLIFIGLAFIFLFSLTSHAHWGISKHFIIILAAAIIGLMFWRWVLPAVKPGSAPSLRSVLTGMLVMVILGIMLSLVLAPGAVLPGHDPIIVPTLAQVLLDHGTTMEVYRPGDPGFTYPPGYPILFSIVSLVASPLATLGIFKAWTVCLLILIPVSWAWMASRVFQIRIPYTALLLLAIVAVFGLERTVTYSIQHGKNSQMLAGAILPALIAILMMSSRRLLSLPFAVIALTAAILIHYSILYMAATFFLAWYIVHFPRDREEWKATLQLGAAGSLSLALFAYILPEAFSDPRAGSFGIPDLGEGLARLSAVFFARHDQLLFIFNWDLGNNLRSPWRGLALIGCLAGSACIGYLLRREREDARSVARMAGVFSIMVLLGIAFATGILPVGITADFARWYLIFPQIGLILAALAAISLYWGRPGKTGMAARTGLIGIFALGGLYMTADLIGDARVAAAQEVSRAELVGVSDTLADLSPNGACFLITESRTIADGLHTVQLYKPLEYAEILTRCRNLNGSFLQRGITGGRSLGDVPDYATLSSLPQGATVYLVASDDLENQYRSAMPQARFEPMNRKIGPYQIWKLTLAGEAPAIPADGLTALLGLIEERLAVMPDVARHKYNSGAVIEDLVREAQVIDAVTAQAVAAGLDKDVAATFFQAQIDASKMIQAQRIAVWRAEGHAPFADVPDLSTVIRPKLDALTPALIAALKDTLPELRLDGAGARLEAYMAGHSGEDAGAFRRAMAPLAAMAL